MARGRTVNRQDVKAPGKAGTGTHRRARLRHPNLGALAPWRFTVVRPPQPYLSVTRWHAAEAASMRRSRKPRMGLPRGGRYCVVRPGRGCWQPAPAWGRRIAPARTQPYAAPATGPRPGGENGPAPTSRKRKIPPGSRAAPGAGGTIRKIAQQPCTASTHAGLPRAERRRARVRAEPLPAAQRDPRPDAQFNKTRINPYNVRPRRTTPVDRHPKPVRRRHPGLGHPNCDDLPDPRRPPAFAAAAHLAGRAIRKSAQQPYTPSASTHPFRAARHRCRSPAMPQPARQPGSHTRPDRTGDRAGQDATPCNACHRALVPAVRTAHALPRRARSTLAVPWLLLARRLPRTMVANASPQDATPYNACHRALVPVVRTARAGHRWSDARPQLAIGVPATGVIVANMDLSDSILCTVKTQPPSWRGGLRGARPPLAAHAAANRACTAPGADRSASPPGSATVLR